jgi:hypothetical protein
MSVVDGEVAKTLSYYGTATALSLARYSLAGAKVGNYALFAGGVRSAQINTVDAYDTSLVRSTPTTLSVARYILGATSIGNYALFGGGFATGAVNSKVVDVYDASLTKTTITDFSVARRQLSAITIGDYALFSGGQNSSYSSVVDVYQYK